jgi:large subunit ribosomal protein L24
VINMKSTFTTTWNKSVARRKQRKFIKNAPLHIKGDLLGAHLSKELKTKHATRSIRVRKGDKVKVLRGEHKGKEGLVESVDVKKTRIYVSKVEMSKKDGSKKPAALHPSNVVITELNLTDKKRKAKLGELDGKKSS